MIGKIKRGDITLDYTEVAKPVTFVTVKHDLDTMDADEMSATKLIFWPHQLDWMIKSCGQAVSECVTSKPATLWGIPLVLCDDIPEAQIYISASGRNKNLYRASQ